MPKTTGRYPPRTVAVTQSYWLSSYKNITYHHNHSHLKQIINNNGQQQKYDKYTFTFYFHIIHKKQIQHTVTKTSKTSETKVTRVQSTYIMYYIMQLKLAKLQDRSYKHVVININY